MTRPTGPFRRSDRLLASRDYRRVARYGVRAASREFVMLVAPAASAPGRSPDASRRLGITASRKVGRAVTRNRVKRRIREWFRDSREGFEVDVDVVVIARRAAADLGSAELREMLEAMRQEIGRR